VYISPASRRTTRAKSLAPRNTDFTSEGAPPPGDLAHAGRAAPDTQATVRPRLTDQVTAARPHPTRTTSGAEGIEILGIGRPYPSAPFGRAPASDLLWSSTIADWDNLLSAVKEVEAVNDTRKEPFPPPRSRDVAVEDWDALMNAVKARLESAVADLPLDAPERASRRSAEFIRSSVLECVTALDHLHSALLHELSRCRQLKREVLSAQAALIQARSELVGTRAGERRARHLALHDGLTALPNRAHFYERIEKALNGPDPQRPPLALLYLDLDGFKEINDTHGHEAGDEMLKIIAARLTRAVRGGDVVSRLGGDEFACLVAGSIGRQHLERFATKVFDAVSAPMRIGRLELAVRPSIGIAICPADGETAEALLKSADAAMYHAKRHGLGHAFRDKIGAA
jgi:diguanylate cyclase (GGDEF)-like protein